MQKVEYSEEAMKWVDYYIEMQALNSILNRYGKARSIIGGLERDDYDGFPAQLYADISGHMSRYSNRFQRMCDDEDNIREKIRTGMENMMKGRLYHVESRSERFGVDVYIRVEKVEWKDCVSGKCRFQREVFVRQWRRCQGCPCCRSYQAAQKRRARTQAQDCRR